MPLSPPDVVAVMLSGGIDSTSLAVELLLGQQQMIRGLYIDAGQRSRLRQESAVRRLSIQFSFPVDIAHIDGLVQFFLPVLSPPFPLLSEVGNTFAGLKEPCGDSISSIITASLYASSIGCNTLFYAATMEDVASLPRLPEMIKAAESGVQINTNNPAFNIQTPFIGMSHGDILKKMDARTGEVVTWSCHWGGPDHCGTCGGCQTRKQRFQAGGVKDYTPYSMDFAC